jgi:hypothetical protein
MFSPIAALPIGDVAATSSSPDISASGAISFTGAATGTLPIVGAGASAFALTGSATTVPDAVPLGSLLGWGPIAAGPISDGITIPTVTAGPTGTAAGTFELVGAVSGAVIIVGRAPDIVLTPWSITVGVGSATINTYPAPPLTPAWSIVVEAPGFRIIDYPSYDAAVTNLPFFDLIGSATAGAGIGLVANSNFSLTGAATATSPIAASVDTAFDLAGVAVGQTGAALVASGAFPITGSATGIYATGAISGIGDSLFDITGAATLVATINGTASSDFALVISATASVGLTGQAAGMFDLFGSAGISTPGGRRLALPSESANSFEIIQPSQQARVIGE